jgi:CRP-like cAMP-binding protein
MFNQLRSSLLNYGNFSEWEFGLITERVKAGNHSRQSTVIKTGETCSGLYFINSGSFRQYYVSEDGREIIEDLFMEGEWMLEYKSFTSQKPSATIIEAMEDSETLVLSVYQLHELIQVSNSFFALGRLLERGMQNQQYQNNRLTPEEKYKLLMQNKPALINKFPAMYIASYLGITPETLSRVRRKFIS